MEKKDNSDDSIPKGKLPMIKIKIPKKAEDTSASAAGAGAGEGEEVRSHYCKECNKSFSSGKALGGHMSSAHVQANKDSSSSSSSKKLSSKRKSPLSLNNACDLCGKKFHSKKSLFGHMRCHPERYWRGMVPRQSIAAAAASSSSDDDRVDSGRHELGFSLMSWPTSKRGRAAAESSEKKEKEQPIVAGLQLLNFLSDESRKEGGDGRRIPAVGGKGKEKVGSGRRDFEIDPNDELVITAIQVLAGGKRETEKRAEREDPKLAPSSSSPEKFKCSVCGKFFPTHQALGGHRSSHNKFKMTVVNTSTRPANPQTPPPSWRKETLVKTNAETATSVAVAHAFDLNVALTAEEEDMEIGDSSNTTPSGY